MLCEFLRAHILAPPRRTVDVTVTHEPILTATHYVTSLPFPLPSPLGSIGVASAALAATVSPAAVRGELGAGISAETSSVDSNPGPHSVTDEDDSSTDASSADNNYSGGCGEDCPGGCDGGGNGCGCGG